MTDPFAPTITNPGGVYDAGEAVGKTMSAISKREKDLLDGRAVGGLFNIPQIDDYVVTHWPGDVIVVCALPGNGKSFVSRMLAMEVLKTLLKYGDGSRCVVWVTTEESVEKVTAHFISGMSGVSSTEMLSGKMTEVGHGRIKASVAEVATWPLYVVGHSLSTRNAEGHKDKTARLSTDEIDAGLDYIMNAQGKDISIVIIDYLHRIRNENPRIGREEHMRNCVDWSRDVAIWTGAPVILVAQAQREIAKRMYPMPSMDETEWTANAGQTADAFFGLWMPKTKMGMGIIESFGGWESLPIKSSYLFIGVGKQKDGDFGKIFLLDVKPHLMEWELLEPHAYNLNNPGHFETDEDGDLIENEAEKQTSIPF